MDSKRNFWTAAIIHINNMLAKPTFVGFILRIQLNKDRVTSRNISVSYKNARDTDVGPPINPVY